MNLYKVYLALPSGAWTRDLRIWAGSESEAVQFALGVIADDATKEEVWWVRIASPSYAESLSHNFSAHYGEAELAYKGQS